MKWSDRLCRRSQVGACIEADQIPLSEDACQGPDPLKAALNDGEDFELLFTLPCDQAEKLMTLWHDPVAVTRIVSIINAPHILLTLPDGEKVDLKPTGYDHFRL